MARRVGGANVDAERGWSLKSGGAIWLRGASCEGEKSAGSAVATGSRSVLVESGGIVGGEACGGSGGGSKSIYGRGGIDGSIGGSAAAGEGTTGGVVRG